MKRSRFATAIVFTALTLSTIFVINARSLATGAGGTARLQNTKVATPIKGIGVVVKKDHPRGADHIARTNTQGSFTIDGLGPGTYTIRLECKACEGMSIGRAGVQITLEGTKDGTLKRTISKQQLVSGHEFTFEMEQNGKKNGVVKGNIEVQSGANLQVARPTLHIPVVSLTEAWSSAARRTCQAARKRSDRSSD